MIPQKEIKVANLLNLKQRDDPGFRGWVPVETQELSEPEEGTEECDECED